MRMAQLHVDKELNEDVGNSVNYSGQSLTDEEFSKFKIGDNLDSEQRDSIRKLLGHFYGAFGWKDEDFHTSICDPVTKIPYKARVELTDDTPVNLSAYQYSSKLRLIIREHIDRLIRRKMIEPASSQWCSPLCLVPKGEKEFRPVFDYRKLNKQCKFIPCPMPSLHDALNKFKGRKYFCNLDMADSFQQVELEELSRDILAFICQEGTFRPLRVPFGWLHSGTVFQKFMNLIFSLINSQCLSNYIDDNGFSAENFKIMCD